MRRRQFLRMAAALTAAGSLISLRPASASAETAVLADQLLDVQDDPTSASVIGEALLEEMSVRPELDHVVNTLMHRLGLPIQQVAALSSADLRTRLMRRTSEDFRLGQTTSVQGWVLGETEACFCRLAALRPS